jgi:hypothetical protein
MLKKLIFKNSYDVMLKYIYAKKICLNVLKISNIFNKRLKSFLIFMKNVVSTKHCDSILLK